MNSMKDCYELANGVKIPCMGYGTYKAAEGNNESIIKTAIEAGYRYFDTASFYDTEEALGRAIHESGIPREEFFQSSPRLNIQFFPIFIFWIWKRPVNQIHIQIICS